MIFIGIFALVFLLVICLNIYDSSNLQKLEDYIKTQNCINYSYSKGSYKAICNKKVIKLENSFIIDLNKNKKEFLYANIQTSKIQKNTIYINNEKFEFKEKIDAKKFYNLLQEKLNNDRNN
ncbi:hypothetical protein CPU12_11160 [Malaciobacter molluscorum LMG 25693]|uniref:Uncharacterized protein n=1 Tax=Malaciobacter molluscorum LMG 25693 TaxID=870501 RepID=A0A2G1DFN1_9BACT|nr:hypothetical protein [Malaciobacter molluscorum]AXX93586.1 hypothetical protein AMOL_2647 [Malaciobacter molluscorum LMG 25693]PHO17260.1 hypothetical protein CPU12_11160 [Malaciobacter molluscorum LMG 25693]RXJ93879.1 hypothetical protein CRV00_09425 [Malaciobacter molluscorum]